MVKLFEPKAWDRKMEIRIEGEKIYENVEFYNSFQLVPIILLDNAIKYGNPGSKIVIKYSLKIEGLYIEFRSYGPIIPPDYKESIFQRGVRAPNAMPLSNSGSGLGLFIASQIVNVHDFELTYSASEITQDNGWNVFTLFIDEIYLAHAKSAPKTLRN
jgi:signal transduction histidine kinase